MSTSKILLQLSGSIACFKACALLSSLVKAGHDVEVVATPSALKFVGEATLEGLTGRRVHTSTFESGRYMNHIHLMRWADVVVLCPASANTLNKFAAGIADDLVSTLFLAHDFSKPYLVAPAMNQSMYAHPATQTSLTRLGEWGVQVLATGTGALACGENGEGRMLEPAELHAAIDAALAARGTSNSVDANTNGKRILITSGGTEEPIDGVRSITNTSTGGTGASLASWFAEHGNSVTLLHARNAVLPQTSKNIELKAFSSFVSLNELLKTTLATTAYDAIIHLAAVADYSLAAVAANGAVHAAPIKGKLDSADELTLTLKRNPKLVDNLRAYSKNKEIKVVAFKLTRTTSSDERTDAVTKLREHAQPDFIVHNDLNEIIDGEHPFTIYNGAVVGSQVKARVQKSQALAQELSRLLT